MHLLAEGMIAKAEIELYTYAMSVLCYLLLPFVLVATMIPLTGLYVEGFILLIPFTLLRRYIGGFHFDNDKVCLVVSYIFLISILLCGKHLPDNTRYGLLSIIGLLIIIFAGKNIEAEVSESTKLIRRQKFIIIIFCLLIMIISFYFFKPSFLKWSCLGIVMTIFLKVPEMIINYIRIRTLNHNLRT